MAEDDRELMLSARQGSREAFTALVDRWQARLLHFFFRQSGERELAEDCTQETFVRLFKARDRYEPDASFPTFLFTIARNYWIDVSRARRVRPDQARRTGGDDEEGEERLNRIAANEPSPTASAMLADDLARLRHALARLPATLREVVQLGVIEALPYGEVAAVLGIPVGTVKSRVHSAVLTLRGILAKESP